MKHLIIIGARGFGREVYYMALTTKAYLSGEYDIKGFLDDNPNAFKGLKGNYPPILGPVETYNPLPDDVFICALGDGHWRKHYSELIESKNGVFISIIVPSSRINETVDIGPGTIIGPNNLISNNIKIGRHVMIQCFCDFGHDVIIGDYASIESYVFLGGYATVGELATMHTKSSILPHKSVGKECEVGFGSVVMRNFKDGVHVFGNPAKIIEL